jgi:hypothetical protein
MFRNGLRGPYSLTDNVIDQEVPQTSPGAFALDNSEDGVRFHATYVGRSDCDVNNQLHVHVGTYKRFKYKYSSSPQEAFKSECGFWHDFEPQDNVIHPRRPMGTAWTCPRCSLFR